MTPASTAPIFTNNKHKTLAVEDILEEQQKAIAPLRTLTLIWVGFLGVLFRDQHFLLKISIFWQNNTFT